VIIQNSKLHDETKKKVIGKFNSKMKRQDHGKPDRKLALKSILPKFGQWDDLIIANYRPFFSSFRDTPHPPLRKSFVKLAN